MKNPFELDIYFKNGRMLEITTDMEGDPQQQIEKGWSIGKKEGAISLGKYIIAIEDIAYIHVRGEKLEEPIRE